MGSKEIQQDTGSCSKEQARKLTKSLNIWVGSFIMIIEFEHLKDAPI